MKINDSPFFRVAESVVSFPIKPRTHIPPETETGLFKAPDSCLPPYDGAPGEGISRHR